jgi:arylsulfatase B
LHLDVGPNCGAGCSQPQLQSKGNYSAGLYAHRTLAVIDEHVREWAEDPLFIYAAFQSVHCPVQVPQRYVKPYLHLDPNRQQFAGMLAALDEAIGTIVDGFKSAVSGGDFWENTLTIFSTDK